MDVHQWCSMCFFQFFSTLKFWDSIRFERKGAVNNTYRAILQRTAVTSNSSLLSAFLYVRFQFVLHMSHYFAAGQFQNSLLFMAMRARLSNPNSCLEALAVLGNIWINFQGKTLLISAIETFCNHAIRVTLVLVKLAMNAGDCNFAGSYTLHCLKRQLAQ